MEVDIMTDLAIVVVFFNPIPRFVEQVKNLTHSGHVIVVDNSEIELLDFKGVENVIYIPLHKNTGIAFAQNEGIRKAIELNYKYILFQDQDSTFDQSRIIDLKNEYMKIKSYDKKIAAIGPLIKNEKTGNEYKSEIGGKKRGRVSSIISSGMLVESSIFSEVGLLEEDLFIDNVDHEWCWRAQNKGFHIYMTRVVELIHNVGQQTSCFLGIQIIKSSAFRSYYKYRNNLWLIMRKYVPLKWKLKTCIHMIANYVLYIVMYKEYGRNYVAAANKGLKDGFSFLRRGSVYG